MKKIMLTIGLWILLISSSGNCAEQGGDMSLNQIMTDIGQIMLDVYPLVMAKRQFTEQDTKRLRQSLDRLAKRFRQAQPYFNKRSDNYQVSYEFISRYLDVLQETLQSNEIDYARSYLYALGEICSSCHTQDSTLRTLFGGATREDFDSDYAYAELNYMTREYDKAINYFDKYLHSSRQKTELDIIQPLQRIITIYIQVQNAPEKALDRLKQYTTLKHQTPATLSELNGWIEGLEMLVASGVGKVNTLSFDALKRYVKQYLGDPAKLSIRIQSTPQQEVGRIWLRGRLYRYLNRNPATREVPVLLYWLAVVDRSIAYNFYFSLADLYLRDCTLNYPQHPYAQKCYREYKNYVADIYQKQGDPLPPGIAAELREMQQALSRARIN
jgi:hypothetical protein